MTWGHIVWVGVAHFPLLRSRLKLKDIIIVFISPTFGFLHFWLATLDAKNTIITRLFMMKDIMKLKLPGKHVLLSSDHRCASMTNFPYFFS